MFIQNSIKFIGLLVVQYITLSFLSYANFCIDGIRAFFIFSFIPIFISLFISYWFLKRYSVLARVVSVFLTLIISMFVMLFVSQQNNLHVMCW